MATIDELISRIEDRELRSRIEQEVAKMQKQRKFGLVFEDHLPECTPLFDIPVKKNATVAKKSGKVSEMYKVTAIHEGVATCVKKDDSKEVEMLPIDDLVVVAEFGEPIYPFLQPLDKVVNAPGDDLWHILIEADNYHALQLLVYLYAGQVDCIYIDPPYNTGARDWKYNNDYVDGTDQYRHSKWLSFIKRRLELAEKLLNPKNSVLIVTIDEKEYLHLGCLLEQMFPAARIQMISSVINPKGNRRDNEFSRCEEYIYFVCFGSCKISSCGEDMLRPKDEDGIEDKSVRWRALLRGASNHGRRRDRPNLFYPLLFKKATGEFVGHGPILELTQDRHSYIPDGGVIAMWPIAQNGEELTWNLQPDTLMCKHSKHFLSFGKFDGNGRVGYYLSSGMEDNFNNGLYNVIGQDSDGAYILELKDASVNEIRPLTIWNKKSHSASEYGTTFINKIIGSGKFSFPKSLYAVHDTMRFFVANNPNAIVLDFFAGSGTTLHAVNLLNAADGGHRRCIMVTNNEVSDAEAKKMTEQGLKPGDEEWDKLGIARYVTWPRTVCTIEGHDINGTPLKGEYIGSEKPMSDGFKTNAAFFKLGFLNKTSVSLGKEFRKMLPTLWMKAGAHGECPALENDTIPPYMLLPQNQMAILDNEGYFTELKTELENHPEMETVYIITDSESAYKSMINQLEVKNTFQLYRDYLDNFRINQAR